MKAAQNAASSQHAQVNLIRLVKSLDKLDPSTDDGTTYQRRKDWEVSPSSLHPLMWRSFCTDGQTVQYARVLLDTLQQTNEGPSSSSSTLSELNGTLKGVEMRFRHAASIPSPLATVAPAAAVPLPGSPSSDSPSLTAAPLSEAIPPKAAVAPPASTVLRQRHVNVQDYLRSRLAEDREGEEAGLLPLNVPTRKEHKERDGKDSLLGGSRPGMGSAQLHEELGGQLADVRSFCSESWSS